MVLSPVSNRREVDFGAGVGRKSVYLYNLPEVLSGHQVRARAAAGCCRLLQRRTACMGTACERRACLPAPHTARHAHHSALAPAPALALALVPQVFGVPSISARFGTAPGIWNLGMVVMARLAPKSEHESPFAAALAWAEARCRVPPLLACAAATPAPGAHRRALPSSRCRAAGLLQDRAGAKRLAGALGPLVRAVDGLVGEKVAMLVEVEYAGGWAGMG